MAEEVDTRPDVAIAELAAEQWGVLSLPELLQRGVSHDAISGRVRSGRLHRLHRGVYAVGHPNPPLEGRLLAAVKACGQDAVLSHYSAAALYGLVAWDERRPEVTVSGAGRSHTGIRVHRTNALDQIARHKGIPVTTPARTLVDLAAILPYKGLRRATREAQAQGLVSIKHLLTAVDAGRRRRGITKLARILAAGPAPTRSELEDALLDLILQGGLAHPDVNTPLILAGRRVIPDFRWPAERLVVEADGAAWHDHRLAREDDAERQAVLEAHGERVIRVTWEQAVRRRAQTLARLRRAGAPTLQRP